MSRLSVIIAAFNAGEDLSTALASVAAQRRPADEVIVVDDASTDDTVAIAKAWSDHLPLEVVRLEVNGGAGVARREAVACSTGDLLCILDADDYWFPDHLAIMERSHERHGGIISSNLLHWIPDVVVGREPWVIAPDLPPPERQRSVILERTLVPTGSLFTRGLYDEAGGYRHFRRSQDWDLWIRMVRCGAVVTKAPCPTGLYRRTPTSLSGNFQYLTGDIEVLEDLLAHVLSGADARVARRTLRRRRAKQALLEGLTSAEAGNTSAARRQFARAALMDRRLAGGLRGSDASVFLQGGAALVAWPAFRHAWETNRADIRRLLRG